MTSILLTDVSLWFIFQGLQNIAALSLSIGVVNKATEAFASLEETKPSKKDSKDSNKKDN